MVGLGRAGPDLDAFGLLVELTGQAEQLHQGLACGREGVTGGHRVLGLDVHHQAVEVSALVHTAGLSPSMDSAERILAVNLDASVRLVDAVRDHMADGSAAILFASNSSYFPMSPEATEAFTQPLPEGGALALSHLVPDSARAYVLSKLGVRALVKRRTRQLA